MKLLLPLFIFSALTLTGWSQSNSATVSKRKGDVKVLKSKEKARQAKLKEKLSAAQSLQTGRRSRAELTFPNKAITRLGANTSFSFRSNGRNLKLNRGTLLLQVPKGRGGATIHSGSVTAAITGTTIMMEYRKGKWVKLISLEGKVSLNTKQGRIVLKPGQMVFLKDDGKVLTRPVDLDLKRLVETSKLVNSKGLGRLPKSALVLIQKEIAKQERLMKSGKLSRQTATKRKGIARLDKKVRRIHTPPPLVVPDVKIGEQFTKVVDPPPPIHKAPKADIPVYTPPPPPMYPNGF